MKKYRLISKNEGTWIKWCVINEKNIVKFVGRYKDANKYIKAKLHSEGGYK